MRMLPINIEYNINDHGVHIHDSYLVTDDQDKEDFLMSICLDNEGLELCRSRKSMLIEWKAHNILYQKGLFKKRTQHTDIEFKQKKLVAFGYRLICFLFKEKRIIY